MCFLVCDGVIKLVFYLGFGVGELLPEVWQGVNSESGLFNLLQAVLCPRRGPGGEKVN